MPARGNTVISAPVSATNTSLMVVDTHQPRYSASTVATLYAVAGATLPAIQRADQVRCVPSPAPYSSHGAARRREPRCRGHHVHRSAAHRGGRALGDHVTDPVRGGAGQLVIVAHRSVLSHYGDPFFPGVPSEPALPPLPPLPSLTLLPPLSPLP